MIVKKGWIIVGLILLLLLSYSYFFGTHGVTTLKKMQARADSLTVMRDSLANEYERMMKRIVKLEEGDPDMIEEEARNLNLAAPGEEMIIINIDSTTLKK